MFGKHPKVDKHSRIRVNWNFPLKPQTYLTLTCALNQYFISKVAWKGKTTLLEPQNVPLNAKSYSKVAERNRHIVTGLSVKYAYTTRLRHRLWSPWIRAWIASICMHKYYVKRDCAWFWPLCSLLLSEQTDSPYITPYISTYCSQENLSSVGPYSNLTCYWQLGNTELSPSLA